MYQQVEKRIEYGKNGPNHKREWRVWRAKRGLVKRFGLPYLRMIVACMAACALVLVVLIVLEATGYTSIVAEIRRSVVSFQAALVTIASLAVAVAAVVPLFKLAFAAKQEALTPNVSHGDVLFKQAAQVKDQLGFLAKVKQELQELFDYLRVFNDNIVIVPIIDDLDRCIKDGRNVRVLEAVQLILAVPGAPVLSFLAVDSRIVVASIEDHYTIMGKANISGYEYVNKIVQIPFALPEPPPEKAERLMSKSLEGEAASPAQLALRLKAFATHCRRILDAELAESEELEDFRLEGRGSKPATFNVPRKSRAAAEVAVPLEPLVLAIEQGLLSSGSELNSKQALQVICAAAHNLGPYLRRLTSRHEKNEEAVEVLCREVTSTLEAGTLLFGEVYLMCMIHRVYTEHTVLTCMCLSERRGDNRTTRS